MEDEIKWLKKDVKMIKHQNILAIYEWYDDEDDENKREMKILNFNGITNRFHTYHGGQMDIKYKDILYWIPIPPIPKDKI